MKRILSILLAILMTAALLAGCGEKRPAETPGTEAPGSAPTATGGADAATGTPVDETAPVDPLCGYLDIGTLAVDGFRLEVEVGTFVRESEVTVRAADDAMRQRVAAEDKYEIIGSPVMIESSTYDGSFFSTDVVLTMPMDLRSPEDDIGRFVFV